MATTRSFANMLNQKPPKSGIKKEEKAQGSPWTKMKKGGC